MKQTFRDPFDYPLRTKKEIDEQLKQNPPSYKVFAEISFIPDLKGDNLHKNSEIAVFVNISEMNFTPKQRERFIYLIGPRYKGKDEIRIKVNTFNNPQQNIEKGKEMIYELFLEAIRAPCE
ncbi:unnamed protein product [Paramecium octaurelia]|uniref:Small ribosomal subunit protein mS35 mitochondrial conserved domain-containing protein n=1 Tax=Paramecium octaurelia TaxID=43137 RepID=A0A8S1VNA5_PAROT|nr:unnamed protein product [Paramecium octaurelia]